MTCTPYNVTLSDINAKRTEACIGTSSRLATTSTLGLLHRRVASRRERTSTASPPTTCGDAHMVRLSDLPAYEREHLAGKVVPPLGPPAWTPQTKPLEDIRIALITTAGLHFRNAPGFSFTDAGFRPIPVEADADDLIMSHSSANFDRSGFAEDVNLVFPIDRFRELEEAGRIGSLASIHLQFHGRRTDATSVRSERQPSCGATQEGSGRCGVPHTGLTQLHPRRVRTGLLHGTRRTHDHRHQLGTRKRSQLAAATDAMGQLPPGAPSRGAQRPGIPATRHHHSPKPFVPKTGTDAGRLSRGCAGCCNR